MFSLQHTETCRGNILLLRTLAGWQVVTQTELSVAVITAQRAVVTGAFLILCTAVVGTAEGV